MTFRGAGVRGKDGQHGGRGPDGRGAGDGGRPGNDGEPGASGTAGGTTVIALESKPDGFKVSGEDFQFGDIEQIIASAQGGPGGDGGRGGPGGAGAQGARGRDANMHQTGTNGGRGGDGGDGGKGGRGGSGGIGGSLVVKSSEQDAYLLMLVKGIDKPVEEISNLVRGGAAGKPGLGGIGGNAGRGGHGGTGYSWTERNKQHYNAGGHMGPDGNRGREGARGEDGADGEPGAYGIQVDGFEYGQRYDLVLRDFTIQEDPSVPASNDGIFEPGEILSCAGFEVENPNPASMCTPTFHQCARVALPGGTTWADPLAKGDGVFVGPRVSIGPLAKHTVPQEQQLYFRIKYPNLKALGDDFDPVEVSDSVAPIADQLGPKGKEDIFQARYERFPIEKKFHAVFPIRNVGGLDALTTIAAGERCVVRFSVQNLGRRELGIDKASRRVVVRWSATNVDPARPALEHMCFWNEQKEKTRLPAMLDVASLPGVATDVVQIQFGWEKSTEEFMEVRLHAALGIECLEEAAWDLASEDMQWTSQEANLGIDVQRRALTFTCVPKFTLPEGFRERPASAIIVYSPGVPSEVSAFWTDLLRNPTKGLGLPTAIWNIQRYGHFDPDRHNLLAEMIEDSPTLVIVVLNYAFELKSSKVRAEKFQAFPSDIIDQAVLHGKFPAARTRILLVGGDQAVLTDTMRSWNCPVPIKDGQLAEVVLNPGNPADTIGVPVNCPEQELLDVLEGRCKGVKDVSKWVGCCGSVRDVESELTKEAGEMLDALGKKKEDGRVMVVCNPEHPRKLQGSCCSTLYDVGFLEAITFPVRDAERDEARWDLPTEATSLLLPKMASVQSYLDSRRSLRWSAAAALPRRAKVDLFWEAMKKMRESAAIESSKRECVYRTRLGHGHLELLVGVVLQELERELRDALEDKLRPLDTALPTLGLLASEERMKELWELPAHAAEEKDGACLCKKMAAYRLDDLRIYVQPPGVDKSKAQVAPLDAEAAGPMVVAADSPLGLMVALGDIAEEVAALPNDEEAGASGLPQSSLTWHFAMGQSRQFILLRYSFPAILMHAILSVLTLGIWFCYIMCCRHPLIGRRVRLLVIPPNAGLAGKAHAAVLDGTRELLCGIRLLAASARAAARAAGSREERERAKGLAGKLTKCEHDLREGGLLPATCWVPNSQPPHKRNTAHAVEEFLRRRDGGLLKQKERSNEDDAQLFGLPGWNELRMPEGQENASPAVTDSRNPFKHLPPAPGRRRHLPSTVWKQLREAEELRVAKREEMGVAAVDKYEDMIVTEETDFKVCELCGRQIPVKHEERHKMFECRNRQQGLNYLLALAKEPTSHKHLTEANLVALEAVCEEGGEKALQKEEREELASLLKYIRIERELGAFLELPEGEVDPWKLEAARDEVRSAAAGRAIADDAQGLFVAQANELLDRVAKARMMAEVERLDAGGLMPAVADLLAEQAPPSADKKRGIGSMPPWLTYLRTNPASNRRSARRGDAAAEDTFVSKADHLLSLVELSRTNGVDIPPEALERCKGVAMAQLWLCAPVDDQLKQCLQFCRKFGCQTEVKYRVREAELTTLRQTPASWNMDEIFDSAGGAAIAKVQLTDPAMIAAFQDLLSSTFKRKYTRDRKGGRVPDGLDVISVKKVMNVDIWKDYVVNREKVAELAKKKPKFFQWPNGHRVPDTLTWAQSDLVSKELPGLVDPLREDVNEHWLFHGTSAAAAEGITSEDFRLNLAGSNAGTLYGRGIYLAECSSKSDEYTTPNDEGVRPILVCRATLGSVYYTDERTPDVNELERLCGYMTRRAGKHHSVLGDREKVSGTFREFITFNDDLVYPAFIVFYKRV